MSIFAPLVFVLDECKQNFDKLETCRNIHLMNDRTKTNPIEIDTTHRSYFDCGKLVHGKFRLFYWWCKTFYHWCGKPSSATWIVKCIVKVECIECDSLTCFVTHKLFIDNPEESKQKKNLVFSSLRTYVDHETFVVILWKKKWRCITCSPWVSTWTSDNQYWHSKNLKIETKPYTLSSSCQKHLNEVNICVSHKVSKVNNNEGNFEGKQLHWIVFKP